MSTFEPSGATSPPTIAALCARHQHDPHRLLDILWSIQDAYRCIDSAAYQAVAEEIGLQRINVEGVATFYAFFSETPQGAVVLRLCDDIVDQHAGLATLLDIAREELGLEPGQTDPDGRFTLELVPCIGMCDQAPAVLVNDEVVTGLTARRWRTLLRQLKRSSAGDLQDCALPKGFRIPSPPGQASILRSRVPNNIRRRGPLLGPRALKDAEQALQECRKQTPAALLEQIRESGLRGRGGAGFSTARKLLMAAETEAPDRVIICNADEGEPGTFKDRVLLTERPELMIHGMTLCARAINARTGILYLRAEYRYLERHLEQRLDDLRHRGLLGKRILGIDGFDFDIRIQRGAGAYICGEESALISSCEGGRGEPRHRPPFPMQKGYLGLPTVVNNVETFACIPGLIARGPNWFRRWGTPESAGSKLFSISGDVQRPGVYELPFGVKLSELLTLCGAQDPQCVVVGGASGWFVDPTQFERRLCFEDLACAGAIMVFNRDRDPLTIARYYTDFFVRESCGYCTPCRVGNVFLRDRLDRLLNGLGDEQDLVEIRRLSETIIATSRCGLGHTSPRPALSILDHFPNAYRTRLQRLPEGLQAGFDLEAALAESRELTGRKA